MTSDFLKDDSELQALARKYKIAPDSFVFAPLADAYRKLGRLDEAVKVCKKGLLVHPRYTSGKVVLGKCQFDLGEVEASEQSFEEVLGLDSHNLVALKYLGMIKAGRGDSDAARGHFERILAIDPENREIRSMLEDLQVAEVTGKAESPRQVKDADFEGDTISLGEDDDYTSDELATMTLADIYAAQGYQDKAARIYREALQRQPDNPEIKRKLADLEGPRVAQEEPESSTERFEELPVVERDSRQAVDTLSGSVEDTSEIEALEYDVHDEGPVEEETAIRPAKADAANTEASEPQESESSELDDRKSYEQFKRWLENMRD